MNVQAACIDITGSNRAMDVAYLEGQVLRLRTDADLASFLNWVSDKQPDFIAVDAPSKANIGLVERNRDEYGIPNGRYQNFRIAEAVLKLKGIGLYNTPKRKPPEWMKRGWDLYSLLQARSYRLLDAPGSAQPPPKLVFEVHPHASFVVGLGWIPQKKQSLAGQLERAAYLRRECSQLGITVDETPLAIDQLKQLQKTAATWDTVREDGISLPSISHDQLDAIAGLTTALRASKGHAVAVGHQDDGVIVLPQELADSAYQWKHK